MAEAAPPQQHPVAPPTSAPKKRRPKLTGRALTESELDVPPPALTPYDQPAPRKAATQPSLPRADASRWGLREADDRADVAEVVAEFRKAETADGSEDPTVEVDAEVWLELAVALETGGVALSEFAFAVADARGRLPATAALRAVVDAFAAATGAPPPDDTCKALTAAVWRLARTHSRKSTKPRRVVSANALLDRVSFATTPAGAHAAARAREARERRESTTKLSAAVVPEGTVAAAASAPSPKVSRKLKRRFTWREFWGCWPLYDICVLPGELRAAATDLARDDVRVYE